MQVDKILIVGAGFVGGPTGAIFALNHPTTDVVICDKNPELIS
jgi:2-polyprenyl-6-methoxyphenol hydroxylase-like FAD-dependent oxidoreductase